MAFSEGVFTNAAFDSVKAKLSDIWSSDSMYRHLNRDTPIFNSVYGEQSITLEGGVRMALTNGKHTEGVQVRFLQSSDLTVDNPTTACTIPDGTETGSEVATYAQSINYEKIVTVKEVAEEGTFTTEDKLAIQTANLLASLDQEGEKQGIAKLISLGADLSLARTGVDLPVGAAKVGPPIDNTIWEIPTTLWTSELIVDFLNYAEDVEILQPKLITGSLYRKEMMIAEATKGEGCCNTYSLYGMIDMISNSREFDGLLGAKGALLIDNAKVGYFNTTIHTSMVPVPSNDANSTHHYLMSSPKLRYNDNGTIKPVMYDIYWQRTCVAEDVYQYTIKGKHRGGFVEMIKDSDDTQVIVAKIHQVA